MGWEDDLFALFDDLEGQAEALYGAEREPELADRSRAEYRQVTLASRLMASVDQELTLDVLGVGAVTGVLGRVAATWCLVGGGSTEASAWIVPFSAVSRVAGASERSVPEVAWSPLTRLSFASALRRVSESGERCVVHVVDGARHDGTLRRVGQDFVELVDARGRPALMPYAAIGAVRAATTGSAP
jgi:hypothetical protein